MVDCLKVFLVLLLAPLPTAPTIFLLALLMSMVLEHQPCPYCSLLIMLVLRTTHTFYGSGDDHKGFGATTSWLDTRFILQPKLQNMIWRDNQTDAVSRGLIPDIVIHAPQAVL
ncbi:hypothetical protein BCR33DRAFT_711054 [Rhizoclosmatium globosum]|uniref:Uncharacterized protein n=1 Tax=Rhizoclosmatium globosum TaxID=329046 RepID=A0A1Y2D366_9FUNG|nr:hypothetical protein BCR33DRAFT_711054 [Rhizoclosmatium globosum]|eukprot:ORY53700.1 hypothetical protein BCR33DRAFT_711054 [Rhizoclosmatium globosum]